MKVLFSLIALLYSATVWGNDGDTFVAKSSEGVEITFMVVSEAQKTCKVGTGIVYDVAIDQNIEGILTIPDSVNGYTVVNIGAYAFYKCKNVAKFHLLNTIKTIEVYAFYQNWNLKEINIPDNVETIGNLAFCYCQQLTHANFHEGLKRIGRSAFESSGLTSIDLPQSLEFIDM